MADQFRAAWARYAGSALSRRGALVTLSAAALGAATAGIKPAQAGKVARKARKRSKKKCKRQIGQCRDALLVFCASEEADCAEDSLNAALACCSNLSNCEAGAALDCFFASA
jgi:hypothetical protein